MKNKYFYPIYKLKIKSWIKYWLIKQTEFKGVLSDILEGISFYLTDSLNMKFKMFDIIGRTTQDGNPTPENPVPIKNTGDNGSVNEKVQNKNLLKIQNVQTSNGITSTVNTDGSVSLNGTTTAVWFAIDSLENVEIPVGTYTFSIDKVLNFRVRLGVKYEDGTRQSQYSIEKGKTSITYTFSQKVIGYYIEIPSGIEIGTKINITVKFQLEQGPATDYVPHSEQNISFPLAEGQKLMQGDYLADDGIHSLWNEDTVNGTTATFSDAKTNGAYYCNQKVSGNLTGQTITFDTSVTNAIVQYELAQEQVIPYTSEQQTAWEQIKNLKTYKPVTHISSEDETPSELKIQYWKEV